MTGPEDTPNGSNGPTPKPVWVYPLVSVFLWGVALVLFLKFFPAFKMIILGVLAAMAVAAMLRPIVQRIPGPRTLSAAVVGLSFLAVVLGVLALLSWALVAPVQAQLQQWPQTQKNLDQVLSYWGRRLGVDHPLTVEQLGNQLSAMVTGEGIGGVFQRTADITSVLLISAMFVFIGSIYLLAEPPGRLSMPVLRMFPRRRMGPMQAALRELEPRLRWWLLGTFISMAVVGVASGIGYHAVGLQFALPLALFAAIAEAVPTIGPAVTFVLSLLLAATQGLPQVLGVTIVYIIVQGLESYVLIPLVMKKAVDVPPIVTLFTIVLWGKIFGVAGLLLAIPLDLVIWSFVSHLVIRSDDAVAKPP